MSLHLVSSTTTATLLTVTTSSSSSYSYSSLPFRFPSVRRSVLPRNVTFSPPPPPRPPPPPPLSLFPRQDHVHCRSPLILIPPRIPYRLRTISATGISAAVVQDAGATALVLAGAYALVLTFDKLTERNIIQQSLSRKLVHILSGLLFMLSWPIFSTSSGARYFASLVPLFNCFRLVTHGLSLATDEGLVKSVTREGRPEELLRGPLYYVLTLIICALIFWRESPVGVISLSMMCAGDGVADIIGRRFGSGKLPYNQQKSWAGSISMFACGLLISIGMLYYFSALGYFQLDWTGTVEKVALVSLVATVVESLTTTEVVDDNISVPLVSMLTAYLSFHY